MFSVDPPSTLIGFTPVPRPKLAEMSEVVAPPAWIDAPLPMWKFPHGPKPLFAEVPVPAASVPPLRVKVLVMAWVLSTSGASVIRVAFEPIVIPPLPGR